MSPAASTRRKKKSPPKASTREAAIRARSSVTSRVSQRSKSKAGNPTTGRGRAGKKSISVYMHPLAKDILAQIARDQQKTVQDLGIEALNLLFTKYNHKPVA